MASLWYGKRRKPFTLDSQRLHWENLLIKMTRLCILQVKIYEGKFLRTNLTPLDPVKKVVKEISANKENSCPEKSPGPLSS